MTNPQLTRIPIAKTGMLICKPVEQVFEAIVNPDITTNFWFSKGSRRLEAGKAVKWDWESHDVSIEVTPKVVDPNERVVIEWPGYSGPTTVEWTSNPFRTVRRSYACRSPEGREMPISSCATLPIPRKDSRFCLQG